MLEVGLAITRPTYKCSPSLSKFEEPKPMGSAVFLFFSFSLMTCLVYFRSAALKISALMTAGLLQAIHIHTCFGSARLKIGPASKVHNTKSCFVTVVSYKYFY